MFVAFPSFSFVISAFLHPYGNLAITWITIIFPGIELSSLNLPPGLDKTTSGGNGLFFPDRDSAVPTRFLPFLY
jgi:hypothetical protein